MFIISITFSQACTAFALRRLMRQQEMSGCDCGGV
jgi:hypothetical protein